MNIARINHASAVILGIAFSINACQAESIVEAPGNHRYFNFTPMEDGSDGGVALANGDTIYYCQNARLGGYDFFHVLHANFPALVVDVASNAPDHIVVDMAYAAKGTMEFNNVVVQNGGPHTITFRYAFGGGLFPALHDRPMGIKVNGIVVASAMHFPRTASFDSFNTVSLHTDLKPGKNTVEIFNISDHGVARMDTMTISVDPSAPNGNG